MRQLQLRPRTIVTRSVRSMSVRKKRNTRRRRLFVIVILRIVRWIHERQHLKPSTPAVIHHTSVDTHILGPHPHQSLCIASHVVRSCHMQRPDAASLGPQLQRFSYSIGHSSVMTSPPCQPSCRLPASTLQSYSHPARTYLLLHAGHCCWPLHQLGLCAVVGARSVNARTAPLDMI